LIIEQGAVFEGSCKMLQMSAAADKNKNAKKSVDEPLDTSKMQPLNADNSKSTSIPNVSSVVS
jgi:cytoskeletal protein CcmA (bactofilin family)